MGTGAITQYIDVAQIMLYVFWIFFAGLILYLRREDKREGYPLESDRSRYVRVQGYPELPEPKTFKLRDGSTRTAPHGNTGAVADLRAQPIAPWPGAPLQPTGNPMLDGVGPGAYAQRPDVADTTVDGKPKIVPLRIASGFHLDPRDPDPRGMPVVGADGEVGGVVREVWVDQSESILRYYEVEVKTASGDRNVLLPVNFTRIGNDPRRVTVRAILARQFADVPTTRSPDAVTLLEEERIMAYYGGGTLYATPARAEPWL